MSSIRRVLERLLNSIWYGSSALSLLLIPMSWPVKWVVAHRRTRAPAKHSTPEGVSVWVIGGLTAGGTGKTPVLIALGHWLIERGYRVGVVSRGYGGEGRREPHWVEDQDDARVVGDEPLLVKQRLGVPVVVCTDRQQALSYLIARAHIDVVLSDDGMQHYAMPRDAEIVVLDAERGLGNGRLLPAGPLREPVDRLRSVDWILERNSSNADRRFAYEPVGALHMATGRMLPWRECVNEWLGQDVAAATGLGQPRQFFDMLRGSGLSIREHAVSDHGKLPQPQLDMLAEATVIVTAKDAVKLAHPVDPRVWVVEIDVDLPPSLLNYLTGLLPAQAPTD